MDNVNFEIPVYLTIIDEQNIQLVAYKCKKL